MPVFYLFIGGGVSKIWNRWSHKNKSLAVDDLEIMSKKSSYEELEAAIWTMQEDAAARARALKRAYLTGENLKKYFLGNWNYPENRIRY